MTNIWVYISLIGHLNIFFIHKTNVRIIKKAADNFNRKRFLKFFRLNHHMS